MWIIDTEPSKCDETSRCLKAKDLREERKNRDRLYIVYAGYVGDECVYVGSGKRGSESHLNSGVSKVYHANQVHFAGGSVRVVVLESWITRKKAKQRKDIHTKILNPLWDRGTNSHIYRGVLEVLAKEPEYSKRRGVYRMLMSASVGVDKEGVCKVYGVRGMSAIVDRPTKALARLISSHTVSKGVYTLYLDTDFLDAIHEAINSKGKVGWTGRLLEWGAERAYTNGYTKVNERGGCYG